MLPLKETILLLQYYHINNKIMNTINLKSLSKAEMTNNNGGFAIGPFLLGALAGGIVYDCVWHWGETSASVKKGFREGMADY